MLGVSSRQPYLALLGLTGSLLHVLNHAIFKPLLFLGAGAVAEACHTRRMDLLGGLSKKMPLTSAVFLLGAAAICGFPPLNGFVSEFLLYSASFCVLAAASPAAVTVPAVLAIAALALVGGLAAACFAKAFGVAFLGEARSDSAAKARDCGWVMRLPMMILAAACALAGIMVPLSLAAALPAARAVFPGQGRLALHLGDCEITLVIIPIFGVLLILTVLILAALRKILLWRRKVQSSCTWACGYTAPSARMQYTGSSFSQPLVEVFGGILRQHRSLKEPLGLFPVKASLSTETPDLCSEAGYAPAFRGAKRMLRLLLPLQAGRVQSYLLYIVLTLIVLILWILG